MRRWRPEVPSKLPELSLGVEALKDGRLSKDSTLFADFLLCFCFVDQRVCDILRGEGDIFFFFA